MWFFELEPKISLVVFVDKVIAKITKIWSFSTVFVLNTVIVVLIASNRNITMPKTKLLLQIFFFVVSIASTSGELFNKNTHQNSGLINHHLGKKCDSLGLLIYEDLGCVPEHGSDDKDCPVKYTCTGLGEPDGNCYFRGKSYRKHELVDNSLTSPSCDIGCFCSPDENMYD